MTYEGGFWSVYWMSVAMWIVALPLSNHLVFVMKPAPTKDFTYKGKLDSGERFLLIGGRNCDRIGVVSSRSGVAEDFRFVIKAAM